MIPSEDLIILDPEKVRFDLSLPEAFALTSGDRQKTIIASRRACPACEASPTSLLIFWTARPG
jgi:hypothetical protein